MLMHPYDDNRVILVDNSRAKFYSYLFLLSLKELTAAIDVQSVIHICKI